MTLGQGKIWCDGKFVEWADATCHILSHVVHYGSSVFEGIRCYETKRGPGIFRLGDHMKRFYDSAKIYRMDRAGDLQEYHEPDAAFVWEMTLTPAGVLYAVTGEPGTVIRVDEVEKAGRTISAFGGAGGVAGEIFDEEKLARQVKADSAGASRMRVFHTKMSNGASAFMAQTINEWLDAHPEVVVKFVQSTVGVWEGKHAEPHLILTVWY